jgi:hypothetical protein
MYEPNSERRDWARAQMTEANYPQEVKTAVERLLEVWYTQRHSGQTHDLTLDAFNKLAQGHAIVVADSGDETWVQLKPGNVVIRDQVRVKFDAYSGEVGTHHNNRRGRVVAIRHGDIIVRYDDGKQPPGDGVHHSPYALEKRVR